MRRSLPEAPQRSRSYEAAGTLCVPLPYSTLHHAHGGKRCTRATCRNSQDTDMTYHPFGVRIVHELATSIESSVKFLLPSARRSGLADLLHAWPPRLRMAESFGASDDLVQLIVGLMSSHE